MLDKCLFIYRISLNKTLNDTPFRLLYGRDAVLPHDLVFQTQNIQNMRTHQNLQ